ncbi:MAG TPA: crotonase/enoyl-CoA hydratase family protein [Polyangiaceae bacterium LLY-WYZ-15_(1-7)]|nr:enoyl-CoA hydratase [Myxococcales bacterium]MAT26496.1 enoyl-CoA hydratase [Sandaracinus sp.]HJK99832.1 crotonase/enoyl-CoA hydratase family protein [Polyangiaceae bacterium LLY-WYZ-15_(1-7)]HJL07967.1 crotonase/enoyl-CoA hydratase family protein [Polyangiaceae bacterium LLY-WYZ-15_(1-7)]HJL26962.1 crotonase/enoyl-CoA hydratase family protein [Polyangiaceae bacterium LLY-WYZ-15_(1-7)]
MTDERVLTDFADGVAHVRLNRPDKRNGLDLAMFEGLVAAGEALRTRSDVRAVVLSGEGKAFCAGLDFKAFMAAPQVKEKLLERPADRPANLAQAVGWIWREVPVPVIAAIHGPCFGGGLQIALGADLRYATPDAQLSVMEIRYGLVPDMGASKTLLDLVPLDVAKELTFTGRVLSGEEAKALGLVTRVEADPLAAALETAKTIASKSPHAIRAGKALYEQAPSLDVRAAFELETELQVALLGSPNQLEAVMASMQKRAPRFADVESDAAE